MNRNVWFNAQVFEQIKKEQKRTGESFNAIVNRIVGEGLGVQKDVSKPHKETNSTPTPQKQKKPVKQAKNSPTLSRAQLIQSYTRGK